MRRFVFAAFVATFFALALGAAAQERVTLATPILSQPAVAEVRVESLYLKRNVPDGVAVTSNAIIRAIFRETVNGAFLPQGRQVSCAYDGDVAETLIGQLNTTNLTTTSLEKRITTRCQADGKLGAGTISGVPQ